MEGAPTAGVPGPPRPDAAFSERRRQHLAIVVIFFLLGLVAGVWAARIPAVKAHLGLSNGTLGLALLGPAVGAILAMPATGYLLGRVSPRRVVRVACVPLGALLVALSEVEATWQLFAALLAWGAATGMVDVAMNAEAAILQEQTGRRIMSRFHACYSIGGLVGAGSGALVSAAHIGLVVNFSVVGAMVMVTGILVGGGFSSAALPPRITDRDRPWRMGWSAVAGLLSWRIAALCVMAFGCYLAEGAANDWSAVYLRNNLGAAPAVAAVAYTAFASSMTVGRLAGDHLADRYGPVRLIRFVGTIGAAGFVGALLIGTPVAAILGFLVIGFGLSFVVPLVFTASAGHGRAGPTLALVSSCGYVGMLVGPPLIGGASEVVGLPTALGLMAVLCGLAALLSPAVAIGRRSSMGVVSYPPTVK